MYHSECNWKKNLKETNAFKRVKDPWSI